MAGSMATGRRDAGEVAENSILTHKQEAECQP